MATSKSSSPSHSAQTTDQRQITPGMSLPEAAELLFSQKEGRELRAKTLESTRGQINALVKFFGEMRLADFQAGHFEHYQRDRGANCSPSTVNHELGLLSLLLKRATLWDPIKEHYYPLKNRAWKAPKIFTAGEQVRLFKSLKENPNLDLGEIVFTITRNTTASGCELRGLRLRDLELEADPPRIHIPPAATKNNIRPRTIPLNSAALDAFRRAVARASKLGSHYPEQYLFPFRLNRKLYDPRRPASASWLRKQVGHLRELTGIEHITPHTFRHLAVTELLEKGAPEQTVIALAGWVGRKMIETYSHARIEARADAVNLLGATGHKTAPPAREPATAPPAMSLDLMQPAIQAEIARQVAIALAERERQQEREPVGSEQSGARLVVFPGGAACR